MIAVLIDGPALEPVSVEEIKAWLRLDGPEEEDLLRALIVAARLMIEAEIGQVLLAQNWRLVGDSWPSGAIAVPIGKVLAVTAARIYSATGAVSTLAPSKFEIDRLAAPNTLTPLEYLAPGRPKAGIEIDLRVGFGENVADVPETLRIALRRLVALWYETRGDSREVEAGLPPSIRQLLRPYRRFRLGGMP